MQVFLQTISAPPRDNLQTHVPKQKAAGVTNTLANITRRNTKKRSVEDTFPSPIPGPNKAARRSQQLSISDSFYTMQHEGKFLGLLEAQGEEIRQLKGLLNS